MGTERGENFIKQAADLIGAQLKRAPQSLVVILGPTASGKTQLALNLAKEFGGEIVSADSRLVYREMDIGTAKPTKIQRTQIKHHLLDLVSPDEVFTLADYQRESFKVIEEILEQKKAPFLVGGTMLYIDSVVYNYELPQTNAAKSYAHVRVLPLLELQSVLEKLNPEAHDFLDWKNPVRLMRALEYYYQTGRWIWERRGKGAVRYPYLLLGLQIEKEILAQRIQIRVEEQLRMGLVEEVIALLKKYPHSKVAMTGIGYRQIIDYLEGKYSLIDAQNKIIHDTVAYAKRQMTWWRRNSEINWLEVG